MEANHIQLLQEELKGVPVHIINETLNYLRYLKNATKNEIVGYSQGKTLTLDNYKEHLDNSREQYSASDFLDVDEIN